MSETKGVLYGIGVGPGDPELLTQKAVRLLSDADLLCLPNASEERCAAYQIALAALPELAQKEKICLDFLMIKDSALSEKSHAENYQRLRALLQEGKQVAFLTIGDPTIYSTFTYMAERAGQEGFVVSAISGIPSFCAAAAVAGISLGAGSEDIHILSGRGSLQEKLRLSGTRILMKLGSDAEPLKQELRMLAKEIASDRKLVVHTISDVGKPEEQVFLGIDAIPDTISYMTIVIVQEREEK